MRTLGIARQVVILMGNFQPERAAGGCHAAPGFVLGMSGPGEIEIEAHQLLPDFALLPI